MRQKIFSFLVWSGIALLVLFWLPALAIVRLFDRDPVRYRTGRFFRKLGKAISRINPNWKINIEGADRIDDRNPYVVVCNHLSNADIPLISNLPWEMKWVAKKELFSVPVLGWMMKMAQDISVDRQSSNKRIGVFKRCRYYLRNNCSVMFFPEGTRSRDGRMKKFSLGAFELAIRDNIPVLPMVIDGTQECLPKKTWVFTRDVYVNLKVLEPIATDEFTKEDSLDLMEQTRGKIADQLMEWRNEPLNKVDATVQ
ncbi:MAG: lysophospholipid acyltransferase family protein [Balneolaceae bacterium]